MIIVGLTGKDTVVAEKIIEELENEFWFSPLSILKDGIDDVVQTLQTSKTMQYNERFVVKGINERQTLNAIHDCEKPLVFHTGVFIDSESFLKKGEDDFHIMKTYNATELMQIMSERFWFELALNPPK